MNIRIEVYCAMCGKEIAFKPQEDTSFKSALCDVLKPAIDRGWVIQQNGRHADIYCSNQCAA